LQFLSQRLLEVQEAERRYIARELHDEIGQLLTGLKLTFDMHLRSAANADMRRLHGAQTLIDELITRMRDLSLTLRPAMLEDLGLLPALLWHIERYTAQTKIQVSFEHTGLGRRRFEAALETAAFRLVQEALTNVARHAQVTSVMVRVWSGDDILGVQIEDHGRGFDPRALPQPSSGIAGMCERALALGGQLSIESAPGSGACIRVEWPLNPTLPGHE
jgi:signal transduction histidine kinase